MSLPHVSIVTLNYNGLSVTRKYIASLLKTDYPNFSLVVVDNGSQTNEAALLKKEFTDKRITYLRNKKNLGYAEGNNRVLSHVKSPYVVLINNDVTVDPKWLDPLIRLLEKDRSIAVIQPKILWSKNKKYFDYSGACGGFIDIFGYPYTRGRVFNTQEKDEGQYDTGADIFWASGATMVIRRSVLDEVGLFDKRFFSYMEEIDLCFRIHQAGYRIVCEPKAKVYHEVAATSSKFTLKKRYWEHRNNLLLILKNYSFLQLLLILPIRLILEYVSMFYYLSARRVDYFAAVVFSQLSLLYYAPLILIEKIARPAKKRVPVSNRQIIYRGSIILSYFIFAKRKYSQLSLDKG